MIKTGDRVCTTEDPNTAAKVVNTDSRPAILIEYPDGKRKKVLESRLMAYQEDAIRITPGKFDDAVRAIMYETAEGMEDSELLDGALEVVGAVCSRLKARLFGEND